MIDHFERAFRTRERRGSFLLSLSIVIAVKEFSVHPGVLAKLAIYSRKI